MSNRDFIHEQDEYIRLTSGNEHCSGSITSAAEGFPSDPRRHLGRVYEHQEPSRSARPVRPAPPSIGQSLRQGVVFKARPFTEGMIQLRIKAFPEWKEAEYGIPRAIRARKLIVMPLPRDVI